MLLNRRLILLWLLAIALGGRLVVSLVRSLDSPRHGFVAYYVAGRTVLEGDDVERIFEREWFRERVRRYEPRVSEIYSANLPTTALFSVPLSLPPYRIARAAWLALNLMLSVGVIVFLVRALELEREWLPLVLSYAFLFQPLRENLVHGQLYVLLLAIVALGHWTWIRAKDYVGGVTFGLMVVIKSFAPHLWLLALLQRRWRLLVSAATVAASLALLSVPVVGIPVWKNYLEAARSLTTEPALAVTAYQSAHGFFKHVFSYSADFNPNPLFESAALSAVVPLLAVLILVGVTAFFAVRTVATSRIFGAFVALALITSPVTLDYHFVVMLLPLLIALADIRTGLRSTRGALLLTACLLVGLDLPYETGTGIASLLGYPKLFGGMIVWGLLLFNPDREGDSPGEATQSPLAT